MLKHRIARVREFLIFIFDMQFAQHQIRKVRARIGDDRNTNSNSLWNIFWFERLKNICSTRQSVVLIAVRYRMHGSVCAGIVPSSLPLSSTLWNWLHPPSKIPILSSTRVEEPLANVSTVERDTKDYGSIRYRFQWCDRRYAPTWLHSMRLLRWADTVI